MVVTRSDTHPKLVASAPAVLIARLQTFLSFFAFVLALGLGCALHFHKIVKNQWYSWPMEWWPSVSATIGDWYPERNLFQLVIAIVAGPRFAMIGIAYLLARARNTSLPGFVMICGALRTLLCGAWVFITSSDHGDVHDVCMISYIVMNIPWMTGTTYLTSSANPSARRWRTILGSLFFATLAPLIYYYIEHKVKRVPGAYSVYAIFEWSLIFLDVAFDSVSILDVSRLEIRIVDKGIDAPLAAAYLAPPLGQAGGAAEEMQPSAIEIWLAKLDAATSETRRFLADSYLAFVFWSNLTVLPIMIFYSSVWSMGLSGEEVLLFVSLSPALLSIARLRNFIIGHQNLFHFLTLGGIAACKIDDEGDVRLRVLAGAVGIGCLLFTAKWWEARANKEELRYRSVTFGVGLIFSQLIKFANHSLNPVWPIMSDRKTGRMVTGGYNTIGFLVGLVAVLDLAWQNRPVLAGPTTIIRRSDGSFFFATLATGGLLFILHLLYTDSGTIIAWSWEGYPVRGPTAMPHGILTILACSIGLGFAHRPFVTRGPWLIVACLGCGLLYAQKGWPAFVGGAVLGSWTLSVLPSVLGLAVTNAPTPGPVFFGAFLVYGILELAATWTVAYAFVPGGALLRERTDLVLGATMACLALGIFELNLRRTGPVCADKKDSALWNKAKGLLVRLRSTLVIVLVLSAVVINHRRHFVDPSPYHPESRLITACIWTMHFAMDGRMWESQRRMADIIRDAEIDVIGLLESDVQRLVGGNRDMTQYISTELNMYADLGPSPSSHTWGCALLSKFPILNSTHHLLPSPAGELAPAIHATLDVYGTWVDVVVAHNGQEEDPLDRELQSKELGRIMNEAWPRPVIFLGYVVTTPHAPKPAPYRYLVEDGRMLDVDSADLDRWCEYILFRNLERVAYARLNRGSNPSITDTELQLAKFVVPESISHLLDPNDPEKPIDPTNARRYVEHKTPDQHRFPSKFYGEGVRGHRFHVLTDEEGKFAPLYYLSEEEEARRTKEWEEIVKQSTDCITQ